MIFSKKKYVSLDVDLQQYPSMQCGLHFKHELSAYHVPNFEKGIHLLFSPPNNSMDSNEETE